MSVSRTIRVGELLLQAERLDGAVKAEKQGIRAGTRAVLGTIARWGFKFALLGKASSALVHLALNQM